MNSDERHDRRLGHARPRRRHVDEQRTPRPGSRCGGAGTLAIRGDLSRTRAGSLDVEHRRDSPRPGRPAGRHRQREPRRHAERHAHRRLQSAVGQQLQDHDVRLARPRHGFRDEEFPDRIRTFYTSGSQPDELHARAGRGRQPVARSGGARESGNWQDGSNWSLEPRADRRRGRADTDRGTTVSPPKPITVSGGPDRAQGDLVREPDDHGQRRARAGPGSRDGLASDVRTRRSRSTEPRAERTDQPRTRSRSRPAARRST